MHRLLMIAVLLVCAAPAAFAQPTLQQQMTAEEFFAAGLNKLSAEELATLNAWLQRQVHTEAAVATEQVREQAREEGRREAARAGTGLPGSGAREPVQSRIVGEFNGFGSRQRYTLENGQVWEQTDSASLAGVRMSNPDVTIRPGMLGAWFLQIEGYNTRAKVRRIE